LDAADARTQQRSGRSLRGEPARANSTTSIRACFSSAAFVKNVPYAPKRGETFYWIRVLSIAVVKGRRFWSSDAQLAIITALSARAGQETNACYPSIETIAVDTQQSERSVLRHLEQLELAGAFVVREHAAPNGSGANVYELTFDDSRTMAVAQAAAHARLTPRLREREARRVERLRTDGDKLAPRAAELSPASVTKTTDAGDTVAHKPDQSTLEDQPGRTYQQDPAVPHQQENQHRAQKRNERIFATARDKARQQLLENREMTFDMLRANVTGALARAAVAVELHEAEVDLACRAAMLGLGRTA
jgi:hypothetical protein